MFDIGFSELLLFGIIALVVLGPEKLPQAARTAGHWYAKFRRTVATLQSEIEAELDLAETRQKMQAELVKIKQAEAEMKREMAELRGSIKEFETAQNQPLDDTQVSDDPSESKPASTAQAQSVLSGSAKLHPPTSQEPSMLSAANDAASHSPLPESLSTPLTQPWQHMWFRLGDYDKARRLPPAPRLPNYHADVLLYDTPAKTMTGGSSTKATTPPLEADS